VLYQYIKKILFLSNLKINPFSLESFDDICYARRQRRRGRKMGKKKGVKKPQEKIVCGTMEGEYENEKFIVEMNKDGRITKWQPLEP